MLMAGSGVASFGNSGTWERSVLRELSLVIPPEYQEHPESDIEDSEDVDTPDENLADLLEQRISENAGGRYDFEIYCDP